MNPPARMPQDVLPPVTLSRQASGAPSATRGATFIPTQVQKLKRAATAHPESDPIRLNPAESD
jgi:hypothetical protein